MRAIRAGSRGRSPLLGLHAAQEMLDPAAGSVNDSFFQHVERDHPIEPEIAEVLPQLAPRRQRPAIAPEGQPQRAHAVRGRCARAVAIAERDQAALGQRAPCASPGPPQDSTTRAPIARVSISPTLNISGGRSKPGLIRSPTPASPSIGTPLASRSATSR